MDLIDRVHAFLPVSSLLSLPGNLPGCPAGRQRRPAVQGVGPLSSSLLCPCPPRRLWLASLVPGAFALHVIVAQGLLPSPRAHPAVRFHLGVSSGHACSAHTHRLSLRERCFCLGCVLSLVSVLPWFHVPLTPCPPAPPSPPQKRVPRGVEPCRLGLCPSPSLLAL